MRGSAAFRASATPGGALAGPWTRNPLWSRARAVPSLDLRFADNKSLVDATTGQNLVTFTRASSGTYVDSQGVIRTAVTNLLLRSEEFNDATWTKTNSTVTTNATTAPNGTLTAEKLITNSGASSGRASVSITVATDTPATLSCYAKQGETNVFGLFISDGVTGRAADFNLSTGTISGTPTAGMSASIQPVGDGWYRCIVTVASASLAGTTRSLRVVQTVVGNDGTSGLFIWGAQFEQSSTVGEYIPTTSTINSAPRFDHNPTTGESLGLLVEEQRTNLLLQSEDFSTTWGRTNSPTITTNTTVAPDGTTTADTLSATATNSYFFQNVTYTGDGVKAYSVFIKAGTSTQSQIQSRDTTLGIGRGAAIITWSAGVPSVTVSNGSLLSIIPFPNGWYRLSVATETAIAVNTNQFRVQPDTLAGTGNLIMWGFQAENVAFPTSYIPTTTATVTRSADVASITGSNFSSWYRQDEGTVFANTSVSAVAPATSLQTQYAIHDGSADNRIAVYKRANADTSARLDISAATVSSAFLNAGTFGLNNLTASAVQINNFAISLNGLTAVADTAGNVPSVNQMNLGSYVGATGFLNGTIRRLTYFPTRLSNTTLQQITQ